MQLHHAGNADTASTRAANGQALETGIGQCRHCNLASLRRDIGIHTRTSQRSVCRGGGKIHQPRRSYSRSEARRSTARYHGAGLIVARVNLQRLALQHAAIGFRRRFRIKAIEGHRTRAAGQARCQTRGDRHCVLGRLGLDDDLVRCLYICIAHGRAGVAAKQMRGERSSTSCATAAGKTGDEASHVYVMRGPYIDTLVRRRATGLVVACCCKGRIRIDAGRIDLRRGLALDTGDADHSRQRGADRVSGD